MTMPVWPCWYLLADRSARELSALQHFAGAVEARGAHHAAAGVGAGTAQVQPCNWRAIARPAGHGTHEEHLVQTHLAVENVAAGDAEAPLQIERAEHLPVLDELPDVGRVLFEHRQVL